jgi:hypothetical protein
MSARANAKNIVLASGNPVAGDFLAFIGEDGLVIQRLLRRSGARRASLSAAKGAGFGGYVFHTAPTHRLSKLVLEELLGAG